MTVGLTSDKYNIQVAKPPGSSDLEQLIADMLPNSVAIFSSAVFDGGVGSQDGYYQTKCYYDWVRKIVYFGTKVYQSAYSEMQIFKFDIALSTWTQIFKSGRRDDAVSYFAQGEKLGHIYEALFADMVNGRVAYKPYHSGVVSWLVDPYTWSNYNTAPAGDQPGTAMAVTQHPNLYGTNQPGFVLPKIYKVQTWNAQTDETQDLAGGYVESYGGDVGYTNAIDYNPFLDSVFFSKNNTSLEIYRVRRAAEGAFRIADIPGLAARPGPHPDTPTMGRLMTTPGGKEVIFEGRGTRVWEWQQGAQLTDPGSWVLSAVTHPMGSQGVVDEWFPVYLHGLGVYMFITIIQNTMRQPPIIRIWKPPAGF